MRLIEIALLPIIGSLLFCSVACGSQDTVVLAEDIIAANMAATNTELHTYNYSFSQIIYVKLSPIIGAELEPALSMEELGEVDLTSMNMHSYTQYKEQEEPFCEAEKYIVGGWMYYASSCCMDSSWCKEQDGTLWTNESLPGQQFALLEEYVDVELLDTESINGMECYKINVTPDINVLWDWAKNQSINNFFGTGNILFPESEVESFSVTIWIDKATYFTVKTEIYVIIRKGEIEMSTTMLLWDFNKPLDISLPSELADTDIHLCRPTATPVTPENSYQSAFNEIQRAAFSDSGAIPDWPMYNGPFYPDFYEHLKEKPVFYIIDICELVNKGLLPDVPSGCYGKKGEADTNFFAGSCDNPSEGHYIWVTADDGLMIFSVCVGDECDTSRKDGYYGGVWP